MDGDRDTTKKKMKDNYPHPSSRRGTISSPGNLARSCQRGHRTCATFVSRWRWRRIASTRKNVPSSLSHHRPLRALLSISHSAGGRGGGHREDNVVVLLRSRRNGAIIERSTRLKLKLLASEDKWLGHSKNVSFNTTVDEWEPSDQKKRSLWRTSRANTCQHDMNHPTHLLHYRVNRGSYCAARPDASVLTW
jgi:hypothetical protein